MGDVFDGGIYTLNASLQHHGNLFEILTERDGGTRKGDFPLTIEVIIGRPSVKIEPRAERTATHVLPNSFVKHVRGAGRTNDAVSNGGLPKGTDR
jgi:hypothetical protein